jgi:hypothetical protein
MSAPEMPSDVLIHAVQSGDRRAALVAMRDVLAVRLLSASARDTAAIAKQLGDTIREIDEMPAAEGMSNVARLADAAIARRRRAAGP